MESARHLFDGDETVRRIARLARLELDDATLELLRRHLIAQEKRLRFLYGGDEYRLREMERQQREQDDIRQRLRSALSGLSLPGRRGTECCSL